MAKFHDADNEPYLLKPRNPLARPGPIPDVRFVDFLPDSASIFRRTPATTNGVYFARSTSSACGSKDTTGACERYTSSTDTTTLPVVLGVALPLSVALVLFVILHRRHVKKLRQEDADDKHKSLDFGIDPAVMAGKKRQKKKSHKGAEVPEMSFEEAKGAIRHGRGMSIDMDISNPYILPPGLQQSRESLHSLSRSMNPEDDKYRPATTFVPNDGTTSYPSSLRSPLDDSSSFTGSSRRRFDTESNRVLLKNAQRVSRSGPPTRPGSVRSAIGTMPEGEKGRWPLAPITNQGLAPGVPDSARESYMSTGMNSAIRASNNYLGAYIRGMDPETQAENKPRPEVAVTEVKTDFGSSLNKVPSPPPPVVDKDLSHSPTMHEQPPPAPEKLSLRGGHLDVSPEQGRASMIDPSSQREPRLPHLSFIDSDGFQQDFQLPEIDMSQLVPSHEETHSTAPATLPKRHEFIAQTTDISVSQTKEHEGTYQQQEEEEDMYDDYYEDDLGYDPRRLTMGMRPLPPDDPSENPEQRANRIRSFYKEYFDESRTPNTQQQQVDYFDGSGNYADDYYDELYYDPMPAPPRGQRHYAGSERHRATFSTGSWQPGSRAQSTASGQWGRQGRRLPPKKKLPPPKPLQVLPTPHKLKDDLFLPIDFAPPASYRERRAGTPDSPLGGSRPYSPSVKAAVPLVSAFDDLAIMPSPHALRKSSTFTGLDFALPPRFGRGDGSGSDSGSIRSNRSAMSAVQLQSIRAGAYRVSRIPKEVAGTKEEMQNALRPQWDMRNM